MLTVERIQNAIWRNRHHGTLCVPNYTPNGWFECDVWGLTAAGYAYEYEIKLSRSDFFADAKKAESFYHKRNKQDRKTKHELLASHCERGPKRFYFVVPDDLVSRKEVPSWAGLIHVRDCGAWVSAVIVREAPDLHRVKPSDRIVQHARSIFYWRYWNLRTKQQDEQAQKDRKAVSA